MSKRRYVRRNARTNTGETLKIIDEKGNVITSFLVPKGQGITFHLEPNNPMDTPSNKLKRDIFAYFNATLTAIEDLAEIDIAAAEDTAEALGLLDFFEEN